MKLRFDPWSFEKYHKIPSEFPKFAENPSHWILPPNFIFSTPFNQAHPFHILKENLYTYITIINILIIIVIITIISWLNSLLNLMVGLIV